MDPQLVKGLFGKEFNIKYFEIINIKRSYWDSNPGQRIQSPRC